MELIYYLQMEPNKALTKSALWYNLLRDKAIPYDSLLESIPLILKHATATMKLLAQALVDQAAITEADILPWQYMTALHQVLEAKMGESEIPDLHLVTLAFSVACEVALNNIPRLPGRTLIALDCSGSMKEVQAHERPWFCQDIGCLVGAALYKTQDADLVLFGANIGDYTPPRSSMVTDISMDLARRDLGATNYSKVFKMCMAEERIYDRILILSDGDAWDHDEAAAALQITMKDERMPHKRVYVVDFSGHSMPYSGGGNPGDVTVFSPFQDDFLTRIARAEDKGDGDKAESLLGRSDG